MWNVGQTVKWERCKLQALVYDSFPPTTVWIVTPQVSENCQLTNSILLLLLLSMLLLLLLRQQQVCNRQLCLYQAFLSWNSVCIRRFFHGRPHCLLITNETKVSRLNSFIIRGGRASFLRACLGAMLFPQPYWYPNRSKGADRVGGQLRGDKECSFSGVISSG